MPLRTPINTRRFLFFFTFLLCGWEEGKKSAPLAFRKNESVIDQLDKIKCTSAGISQASTPVLEWVVRLGTSFNDKWLSLAWEYTAREDEVVRKAPRGDIYGTERDFS